MSRPENAHRIKSYSAASGYVYQYSFHEVKATRRGFARGNEYIYMFSADRKTMAPLKIFVRRDAVESWSKKNGRALTGTEEYAAAKMRLFHAFDEAEQPIQPDANLVIDESNLEALLTELDI
jgi:hypothetical protein